MPARSGVYSRPGASRAGRRRNLLVGQMSAEELVTSEEFLLQAASAGAVVRAIGIQDGQFGLCLDGPEGSHMVGNRQGRTKYFPSLNHIADWLQRHGINRFMVDVELWRDPDTARHRTVARP